LYEAPTSYEAWNRATNVRSVLDTLIDAGAIPPMIAVFIDGSRGPYPDSECADSVDGRERMDTHISDTAVSYVDSHFATIARREARAVIGFSQGGYCAAILALRHPTVYGTSIPISGYFRAAKGDASSWLPFGRNAAALAAASPMELATKLPRTERKALLFIVVASPSQPFYGAEATSFENLLAKQGYRYLTRDSSMSHGWIQVREQFPAAVEAWASHLAEDGVT
jgi:S-formylglutathione hydrolase FrmB